jgi:site-specific DNA-methyltransferase (adenine-specific)
MTHLHLGRWQDVLADCGAVDAIITDPPYSARTHSGQSDARAGIGYAAWSPDDVRAFVDAWAPRCLGWMVALTDDVLAPVWREAYQDAGRLDFAPLPILQHRPRLQGDGPGSGTVWMMVSRPRGSGWSQWGSLPCWYQSAPEKGAAVVGAKPLDLMKRIVRDYSRPGHLVCDPCAGGGTTLLAALIEGRHAIGAEMDPATHRLATERLARGYTPTLFGGVEVQP